MPNRRQPGWKISVPIPEEGFMNIRKRQFTVMLWVAVAAAFFLGGTASAATYVSPVGEWDFTVTGAKNGSAYLRFDPDQTITGFILVVPAGKGGKDHVASFGFGILTGEWQVDQRGQIVGYLNNDAKSDVRLDITSFSGKVKKKGASFTFPFNGITEDGKVAFNGAPFKVLSALPTAWTIQKKAKKALLFTEIFTALPDAILGSYNVYALDGEGADKCIKGYGVLSRSTNLNISFIEYPRPDSNLCSDVKPTDTGVGSAGVGKVKLNEDGSGNVVTGKASLAGVQEGSSQITVSMPVFCQ
jgi:hypothetical protein